MLCCLFAVGGGSPKAREFPAAAFCFSPLPSHGVGYMILSSDLPLAEPEQIERFLCAASTNAFKCFFPKYIANFGLDWVLFKWDSSIVPFRETAHSRNSTDMD